MKTKELEANYKSTNPDDDIDGKQMVSTLNKSLLPMLTKALTEVDGFDKRAASAIEEIQKKIVEYQDARIGNIVLKMDESETVKKLTTAFGKANTKILDSVSNSNVAVLDDLHKTITALQGLVGMLARKKPDAPIEVVVEDRPRKGEMFIESSSGVNYKMTWETIA